MTTLTSILKLYYNIQHIEGNKKGIKFSDESVYTKVKSEDKSAFKRGLK